MLRLSMMLAARQRLSEGLASKRTSTDVRPLALLRLALYLIVTVAVFEALVIAVLRNPVPVNLFREDGLWEWLQFVLVGVSGGMLWINGLKNETYSHTLKLCGLLALFVAVRELDHFLDVLMFAGAYKIIHGLVAAAFVYVAWTQSHDLLETLLDFAETAPFYFFVAAVLVVGYAGIIGQAEFWAAMVEGEYNARSIKRIVEEMAESMGYLLLFFGAIETCFLRRTRQHRLEVTKDRTSV